MDESWGVTIHDVGFEAGTLPGSWLLPVPPGTYAAPPRSSSSSPLSPLIGRSVLGWRPLSNEYPLSPPSPPSPSSPPQDPLLPRDPPRDPLPTRVVPVPPRDAVMQRGPGLLPISGGEVAKLASACTAASRMSAECACPACASCTSASTAPLARDQLPLVWLCVDDLILFKGLGLRF